MRRIRRIILLVSVLASVAGIGFGASPADARDPGPGGGCRLVNPWIDEDLNVHVIECYY